MVHQDMKKPLHKGLIAGINASLKINGIEPLILKRSEAYIGVMIDDLVNKSTEELTAYLLRLQIPIYFFGRTMLTKELMKYGLD